MAAARRLSLTRYIGVLSLIALAGIGLDAWASAGQPILGPRPSAFAVFAICCLLTELRPLRWLRLHDGGEVTASWTFMMALLLVAPPAAVVATAAAVFIVGDIVSHKSPDKVLFNASQIVIALSLGYAVLRFSHQNGALLHHGSPTLPWFAAFIAAAAVVFAANSVLTCVAIALHQGTPVTRTIRDAGMLHLSTDGMLLALSPILVVVAERSLRLVPLLLLTTWAVYRSAASALNRRHEANHDPLTHLPNRRMFNENLDRAIEMADRTGQSVGVVLLDLNGFKMINDRLGHPIGDRILLEVASRLNAGRRSTELVARLGGDEFALLVSPAGTVGEVEDQARLCLAAFDENLVGAGFPVSVGASIGVAVLPYHASDAATLLQHADEAMYKAKRGRLGVVVYDTEVDREPLGRVSLLTDLTKAVERGELFLEYQPQISLATNQLVGVEALVRWCHPCAGVILPTSFMPLAEHTQLIRPITDWVLRAALTECARWHANGLTMRVSVNASARDFEDQRFVGTVERELTRSGLDPSCLELEITENALTEGQSGRSVLAALRSLGVAVSIDDFGTGYSSMTQLRDLMVDQIKLDKKFVSRIITERRDAVIVEAIISLGRSLGLQTVAEGAEDLATVERLRELGCEIVQGFYYGRPMTGDRLMDLAAHDEWPLRLAGVPEGTRV